MPHSLRAKLSGLRYKGILEDKDYKETKDEGTADTDSDVRVYIPCRDRDRSGNQRTCKWLEEVDNESLAAVLRAIRVASKLDMYEQDYLMEAADRLEGAQNEIYNDTNV